MDELITQLRAARIEAADLDRRWARAQLEATVLGRPCEVHLGRYRLTKFLGAGALASVYLAEDSVLGRKVALKVLRQNGAMGQVGTLAEEARKLASIDHPRVVRIFDIGSFEELRYMVMEYIPGQTVAAAQPAGGFPRDRLIQFCTEAAEALAEIHGSGLVHGDFKLENLVLSETGHLKIIDFGFAQQIGGLGYLGGTPKYMAPELSAHQNITPAADQFAYARAMLELVETRQQHTDDGALEPLRSILQRAQSCDPSERFADMQALRTEMRGLEKHPRRIHWPQVWGAAAVLLCVAALTHQLSGTQNERCHTDQLQWYDRAKSTLRDHLSPLLARMHTRGASPHMGPRLATRAHAQLKTIAETKQGRCHDGRDLALRTLTTYLEGLGEARAELLSMPNIFDDLVLDGIDPHGRPVALALLEARAALEGGRLSATDEVLKGLEHRLGDDPSPWIRSRILWLRAGLLRAQARAREADAKLHEALVAALKADDRDQQLQIRIDQIRIVHSLDLDLVRSQRLIDLARASAEASHAPWLKSEFALVEAQVQLALGHLATAERRLDRAEQLREAELGPDHPANLPIYMTRATLEYKARHFDITERWLDRMHSILQRHWGQGHPLAAKILARRGQIAWRRGQAHIAVAFHRRAAALSQEKLGAQHPDTLARTRSLAHALSDTGEHAQALEIHRRVLEGYRKHFGEGHIRVARALASLAGQHKALGQFEQARRGFEQALAISEARAERGATARPYILSGLADLDIRQSRAGSGLEHASAALAAWREHLGERHPKVGWGHAIVARALLAEGRRREAIPELEQALELHDPAVSDPAERAALEFDLARALASEQRQHTRALGLARRALATYRNHPPATPRSHRQKSTLKKWIATMERSR